MKTQIAALLVILGATAAAAQPAPMAGQSQAAAESEYRACLALLGQKPGDAFEKANAWRAAGGGLPARHCEALALVELGQYGEAATRLMLAAEEALKTKPAMAAEIFGQAGNAWFLAGEAPTAIAAFDAALKIAPDHADVLIDRAFAHHGLRQWGEAKSDLDRALAIDPGRPDAYALRASALRQLGDRPGALADAEAALKLDSGHREALLERGLLRSLGNDKAGARADWLKLIGLAPQSPAAEAATRYLEKLDVTPPAAAPSAPAAKPAPAIPQAPAAR